MKILCRSRTSTAVCRSHASTAVCLTDPRAVISPRRSSQRAPYGGIKYSRLGDTWRSASGGGDRIRAVTLSMVTKRERPPPEPKQPSSTTTSTASNSDQLFQMVVMRVSIHCQGCAGKVRKHISKMEGVTSFTIDVESKRVTVMGHVSPVGVLESISKVKKAEFWTC